MFSHFMRDMTVALTVDLVISILAFLKFDLKTAIILGPTLFIIFALGIIWFRYNRFFKLMKADTLGYYYTFEGGDDNLAVYREARDRLCYLGISANSILEYLRQWAEENLFPAHVQFLLLDPDNVNALIEQKRYEKGVSHVDYEQNLDLKLQIDKEASAESKRIRSAIAALDTIEGLKNKFEIRLYQEFIPWWMYMVDENKIYLGILRAGRRGQNSSSMVMKKHSEFATPFDPFKAKWDSLWNLHSVKLKDHGAK